MPFEAAEYLSERLKISIGPKEIFRLALDGELELSLHFPAPVAVTICKNGKLTQQETPAEGLWTLMLAGEGKLEVEKRFAQASGLPPVALTGQYGPRIRQGDRVCALIPEARPWPNVRQPPESAVPPEVQLVVAMNALKVFEQKWLTPGTSADRDHGLPGVAPERRTSELENSEWVEYWKHRDAWTPREFAQLCCGLNPNGVDNFRGDDGMSVYNEARDSIMRAVRVKVLPVIEDLAWPPTGPERFYDATPTFRPSDVAAWAVARYPKTFPYAADAWGKPLSSSVDKNLGQRERDSLLAIIAGLAASAQIDISKTSKAAAAIEAITEQNGARVAARTIEDHLKLVPAALERKST